MARLYSNENVLTIQDTGKADQSLPDPEVLKFATIENRALLTLNRLHFIRLHQKNAGHAGIIVCTFDRDFEAQAKRIHGAISDYASLVGQLLRINRGN